MKISFEILIATMFREDLNFLDAMFSLNDSADFNIIIVNQTSEDKLLSSDRPNVKVINSLDRGSPASRNLAIRNATADVCLMADDDIVYQPHLKKHIEVAYSKHPEAAMISFEAINEHGHSFADYFREGLHDKKSLKKQHPDENSGRFMGSDDALYARSALTQRFYGNFSYLWLLKYVLFIYRHDYITFSQMTSKFRMGLNGIAKYKALSKSGEIDKIHDS